MGVLRVLEDGQVLGGGACVDHAQEMREGKTSLFSCPLWGARVREIS